jgi:hypothetical protein
VIEVMIFIRGWDNARSRSWLFLGIIRLLWGEMMVKASIWCTNARGKRNKLLALTKMKEKKRKKGVVITVVLLSALRVSVACGWTVDEELSS